MCITGALIGGSLIGAGAGIYSADKAASAQADAARDANELQKYMFDTNVDLMEPWRETGEDALAAMSYEMGLGPRPTFGAEPLSITTIGGEQPQTTQGRWVRDGRSSQGDNVWRNESGETLILNEHINPNTTGSQGQPTAGGTRYQVGDQTFGTMEEAEAYANANATGGTEYQGFQASPGYEFRLEEGGRAIDNSAASRGMTLSGATMKEQERYAQGVASDEYGNYYNRLAGLAGVGQTATNNTVAAGQNYANAAGQNTLAAGDARASGYMGMNDAFQGGVNNMFSIYGMQQAGMMGQPGQPMTSMSGNVIY